MFPSHEGILSNYHKRSSMFVPQQELRSFQKIEQQLNNMKSLTHRGPLGPSQQYGAVPAQRTVAPGVVISSRESKSKGALRLHVITGGVADA